MYFIYFHALRDESWSVLFNMDSISASCVAENYYIIIDIFEIFFIEN